MKHCPQCGISNPDNVQFCTDCSEDFDEQDSFADNQNSENTSGSSTNSPREPQPMLSIGQVKLVVKIGKNAGMAYLLDEPTMTLGRRDENYIPSIDLFDQEDEGECKISRRHAQFRFLDGNLYIIDLDSANGTFIDRGSGMERVPHTETETQVGDVIALGKNLIFKIYSL